MFVSRTTRGAGDMLVSFSVFTYIAAVLAVHSFTYHIRFWTVEIGLEFIRGAFHSEVIQAHDTTSSTKSTS